MNKKTSVLFLALMLVISGCSKKEVDPERVVEISQCGLIYTAPESWKPYEKTNIVPLSSATTEGDIFAHVQFNYSTDESMEKMNSFDPGLDTTELLIPFAEIFVIDANKLKSPDVNKSLGRYDTQKEVKKLNGYYYYLMSDYNGSLGKMNDDEKAVYEELKQSVAELEKSIKAFPFDEMEVYQAVDTVNRTLTFVSSTLEGEEISSEIFSKYDLTIVNFWASYCYPDIDETAQLQKLYEHIADYPRVNLLQVVIDTPEPKAQAVALEAKQAQGGKFKSVMTDTVLAQWITKNLEGLPTTVFVNSSGVIVGDQIKGIKTYDEYVAELNSKLTELNITG